MQVQPIHTPLCLTPKTKEIERQLLACFLDRFWSKVQIGGPDECWLWKASLQSQDYGAFNLNGRSVSAHRLAYELVVGPIPDGLTIDHVKARGCRHRHCVNPAHLEPVTQAENNRRKDEQEPLTATRKRAQTHCHRGHPFDAANTIVRENGTRHCRACHNALQRERLGYKPRPREAMSPKRDYYQIQSQQPTPSVAVPTGLRPTV